MSEWSRRGSRGDPPVRPPAEGRRPLPRRNGRDPGRSDPRGALRPGSHKRAGLDIYDVYIQRHPGGADTQARPGTIKPRLRVYIVYGWLSGPRERARPRGRRTRGAAVRRRDGMANGSGTGPARRASDRGRYGRLSRERVLAAALRLVDDEGLSALSMRRLGAELSVEAMALYRYAASKDALLDGLVEALYLELEERLGTDPAF